MIVLSFIFTLLPWALLCGAGFIIFVMAKRLLQFDRALESINDILLDYADDLRKMSRGDVLQDHPEVMKFHRRNAAALKDIEAIIEGKRKVVGNLPLPEVE